MSNVECRMSNVECRMSNVECRMSNVECHKKYFLQDSNFFEITKFFVIFFLKHQKNIICLKNNPFSCIGSTIRSEVSIATGRINCALTTSKYNYIVELKTDQTAEMALKQIEVKEYYKPYLAEEKPIILIGININTSKKKELSWVMREMK